MTCQAKGICDSVTGEDCQHQDYDCNSGRYGSYYPPSHGGGSNFNFAYAYDFGSEVGGSSDYGNICDCNRVSSSYGLYGGHQYCGTGHWYRR